VDVSPVDEFLAALAPRDRGAASAAALRAYVDRLCAQRDRLRAILAPLLDEPFELGIGGTGGFERYGLAEVCRFCGVPREWMLTDGAVEQWLDVSVHAQDCLVRQRDALLGRDVEG
jgi:hypothetical protein